MQSRYYYILWEASGAPVNGQCYTNVEDAAADAAVWLSEVYQKAGEDINKTALTIFNTIMHYHEEDDIPLNLAFPREADSIRISILEVDRFIPLITWN